MELLILAAVAGGGEKLAFRLSGIPQIREAYESHAGYVVVKARVEDAGEVRRVVDAVRRCPGVLRVDFMIARKLVSR